MSDTRPSIAKRPPAKGWVTDKGEIQRRVNKSAYYEALGRFVDMFARVETSMALALWYYAKTPKEIARAVFSGVRIRDAIANITRIAEATGIADDKQKELKHIFDHLGLIISKRNDILHYGAISVADGKAMVTNALKATVESKIYKFSAHPEVLDNMTADLKTILLRLQLDHSGSTGLLRLDPNVEKAAYAPWQYKPEPQNAALGRVAAKSQNPGKHGLKPPRQPPP